MLHLIDGRSGEEIEVGDAIRFTIQRMRGGVVPAETFDESWRVLDVKEGLFRAEALIEYRRGAEFHTYWQPLVVRFFCPGYFLQKVGIVPS